MCFLWKKLKGYYKNLKIQQKLTFSHLIIVLIPMLVIGVFFYTSLYDMIVSNTIRSEQERAAETAPLVEDAVKEIIDVHRSLRGSGFYKGLTSGKYLDNLKELSYGTEAEQFRQDVLKFSSMESISAVRIYVDLDESELPFTAGRKYSTLQPLDNIRSTHWYGIFQGSPAIANLLCPSFYLGHYEIENYGNLAYVTRDSINNNGEYIPCYIVTYFSDSYFTKLLQDNITSTENVAYLVNSRDNLVATSNSFLYGTYPFSSDEIRENIMSSNNFITKTVLGKKVYAGFYRIKNTDWYMVAVMPADPIMKKSTHIICNFLLIYIAFLLIAFIIASRLSHSMTRRLSLVVNQMAKVRFEPPVQLKDADSQDEIGELIDTYNYMTRKMDQLMTDQAKAAEELRIAEFRSLQAQINPHFLYNTMDMINWLAQQGRTDEVSRAVQSLSRFYKLTLSRKQSISTIYREAEHVSIYLQIQNMRYHDSITFVSDIPDELMEYQIPKLTLQPIIENSVLHGILETADKTGTIVLTGWMEDGDIVLLISDDGVGIAPDKLPMILSGEGTSISGGTNIAIYNTHRRLQVLYGADYGLTYSSDVGKGTEVQIRIPAKKDAENK